MSPLEFILLGYAALGCAYWAWILWGAIRIPRGMPLLAQQSPEQPERWPRLSVVVAACNEGPNIEAAARSLLAQDYPDIEVILVDDRSTDDTGSIVDRLAAEDGRVSPVHVTDLPDGWLGKVHALEQGVRRTTGAWILLTDADVHFHGDVLRRAVAYGEQQGLDHLAAAPDLQADSFLLDTLIATFLRTFCAAMRVWKVSDPKSRAYIGVGAFNLVRRAAYDRTEGFAWLRLEVADDVGLGMMLKRSGARSGIVNASGLLRVCWYPSLADMARGAEKGYASIGHCRFARMFLAAVLLMATEMSPLVGLVPLARPFLQFAAAAMLLMALTSILRLKWWTGYHLLPALSFLLAAPVGAVLLLRAGWLGMRRGGVVWRGTLYPSEQLRRGSRIPFP